MDIKRSKDLSIIIPNHREKWCNEVVAWCKHLYPFAQIIVSHDNYGMGKGWAIKQGLKEVNRETVVLIDADMDIHPKEIKKLLAKKDNYDIVIGVKDIKFIPFRRKLLTIFSRLIIRILFGLPISDTQTGLKLINRKALVGVNTNGFAYDVEMLAKAHDFGYVIGEVEIDVHTTKSKSFKTMIKTLKEMLIVWMGL